MSLRVTILGCGSSGGVPRPALGWGDCDPHNPKNRRRRCSLLVERQNGKGSDELNGAGTTRVLVDTSPDLREQLLDAQVDWLDAIFYTHEHADHTHGIDDLRALFIRRHRRLDAYFDETTARVLLHRFDYCFVTPPGSVYPPILNQHRITAGTPVEIAGEGGAIAVTPFGQDHGDIPSLGYRFGPVAYSSDLVDLPDASVGTLAELDLWIVDALRFKPHPSHFSVDDALRWIERIKPKRAILTNMHSDLDYAELKARLPAHVEPAYDGMRIELDAES
jgi:phosphoribosyl 1,2-cyclic phosphate phosphodiesterase